MAGPQPAARPGPIPGSQGSSLAPRGPPISKWGRSFLRKSPLEEVLTLGLQGKLGQVVWPLACVPTWGVAGGDTDQAVSKGPLPLNFPLGGGWIHHLTWLTEL